MRSANNLITMHGDTFRGLIYKTSYDKYKTMLQHADGL